MRRDRSEISVALLSALCKPIMSEADISMPTRADALQQITGSQSPETSASTSDLSSTFAPPFRPRPQEAWIPCCAKCLRSLRCSRLSGRHGYFTKRALLMWTQIFGGISKSGKTL